jgi:thymidylate kinase
MVKGKLICFIGPDGSGKTSSRNQVFSELKKRKIYAKKMYFSSLKRSDSRIFRAIDLILKLYLIRLHLFLGKIILTDRYIYLTFRNNNILKKFVRIVFPKPDLVFIMVSSIKILKERREKFIGVGDKYVERIEGEKPMTPEEIEGTYKTFFEINGAIKIDTEKPLDKNLKTMFEKIDKEINNK